jgi:rhodanese-related sulfurtransferase
MRISEQALFCHSESPPAAKNLITPYVDLFGNRWLNIPQETLKHRLSEIPPDKRLLVVCNSGVRSFEALRQLETAGLCDAFNLQGGIAALKKSGALDLKDSEEPAKE